MKDDPILDRFPHSLRDLEGPEDEDRERQIEEEKGEQKADMERDEP